MSRYHGALPKLQPEPKEKRRHSRRSRKKARVNPLTEPQEVPTPAPLNMFDAPGRLTEPEIPITPRRSEVTPSRTQTPFRTQPDVIDLTGEDWA